MGAGETWGKLRQEKTLQQPSTQSDLESRPTGQAPGSRSKLLRKAAAHFPALGTTNQKPRFQFGRREAGKGGESIGIHTWPPLRPLWDSNPHRLFYARVPRLLRENRAENCQSRDHSVSRLRNVAVNPSPPASPAAPTRHRDFARIKTRQRAGRPRSSAEHWVGAQESSLARPFPPALPGQRPGRPWGGDELPPGG